MVTTRTKKKPKPTVLPAVFEDGELKLYGDLPDKFSDLIILALDDLQRVEKLPRKYRVDMTAWHASNSHCSVCFAGSVIAGKLAAAADLDLVPGSYDRDTARKLDALDAIRGGNVVEAIEGAGVVFTNAQRAKLDIKRLDFIEVPPYDRDQLGFKGTLRQLAWDLRKIGL